MFVETIGDMLLQTKLAKGVLSDNALSRYKDVDLHTDQCLAY